MTGARPMPHNVHGLPVLTEVIELPRPPRDPDIPKAAPIQQEAQILPLEAAAAVAAPVFEPVIDEEQIVQRVLADLQRDTDLMLDYRLRQALNPALARLSETLVHDVREELAATLRDVVARAVSQELARRRGR